jgi:ribonuclease HI
MKKQQKMLKLGRYCPS